MKIIESVSEMKKLRKEWANEKVGFVPTMGALHRGHEALIQRSHAEVPKTVVSIFVNPTQFNDPKDLEKYPQPRARDLEILERNGVDAAFLPNPREVYSDDYRFELREKELSNILCGPTRPGHFAGVLTVVLKLFNIVQPTKAYFGEKDFQQLRLIQEMSRAFFLDVEVVPCATVREDDGLAMSSRNTLLSAEERKLAPVIYHAMKECKTPQDVSEKLTRAGFNVEYVEDVWGRRFVAARLGGVRLIDNIEI